MQSAALGGLVYLKLLPLTEIASLIDSTLCLHPTQQSIMELGGFITSTVHAYLNLGTPSCPTSLCVHAA